MKCQAKKDFFPKKHIKLFGETLPRDTPRTFFEKKVLGTPKNFNVMEVKNPFPSRSFLRILKVLFPEKAP